MKQNIYFLFFTLFLLITCSCKRSKKQFLSFQEVPSSLDKKDMASIRYSKIAKLGKKEFPIAYHTIIKTGDTFSSGVFGRIFDKFGKRIDLDAIKRLRYKHYKGDSNYMDHSTLLPRGNDLYLVTQFELAPAAIYITQVQQDTKSGLLKATNTRSVALGSVAGIWSPCAGSRSPWLTHLGSEEYEPDARKVEKGIYTGKVTYGTTLVPSMAQYLGESVEKGKAPKILNPYDYGYITEIDPLNFETVKVTKHYSMGRFSHELAYVMPDQRTVYLSDDGSNIGFYMYYADAKANLQAGTLYAAKWIQKSSRNGGRARLLWVKLAHLRDAEIAAAIAKKPKFSEIFAVAEPVLDKESNDSGSCPESYRSINTEVGHECLRLQEGKQMLAAALETRRYAAYLGATTEFHKEEGISYDPDAKKLYVAMSRIRAGMEDLQKEGKPNNKYDLGGTKDIKLPYNFCGSVFALDIQSFQKDSKGEPIASSLVAVNMIAEVSGIMNQNKGTPFYDETGKTNICDVNQIGEPDNLTYITGTHTLIVGEDSEKAHRIDNLWAYDTKLKKLTRLMTVPYGSEITSPFYYKNINGFAYITTVIQHPYGESDKRLVPDDSPERRGHVGYFGPLPVIP